MVIDTAFSLLADVSPLAHLQHPRGRWELKDAAAGPIRERPNATGNVMTLRTIVFTVSKLPRPL